jgi:hypothetical protein
MGASSEGRENGPGYFRLLCFVERIYRRHKFRRRIYEMGGHLKFVKPE